MLAARSAAAQGAFPGTDYLVAVGAGAALGDPGWGTELGTLLEVSGRVQPLPWLGAGASFFQISAGNNENFPSLQVRALELHASLHPLRTRWLDPFARAGVVRVVGTSDGGPGEASSVRRWGFEGVTGIDVAVPYFALGFDLRYGFTNRAWTMAGLHVEARLPLL
jgi:hypothetical protein